MQDLRLVGVHEDGRRVVLGGPDGQRFTLPIDDALRAAARHDRPRLGQLQIEMEGGARPREVQALVRSGLTAEEVSARTGWSIERVRKYEGPVIDERYHIAIMGRTATLPHTQPPTPLEERVVHRLATREVDPGTAAWDAWRGPSTSRQRCPPPSVAPTSRERPGHLRRPGGCPGGRAAGVCPGEPGRRPARRRHLTGRHRVCRRRPGRRPAAGPQNPASERAELGRDRLRHGAQPSRRRVLAGPGSARGPVHRRYGAGGVVTYGGWERGNGQASISSGSACADDATR